MYDFETYISRDGIGAIKWDRAQTTDGRHPADVMPFSTADMEFACAPEILSAIRRALDVGILGYNVPTDEYYGAVCAWMNRRHKFRVEKDWIVTTYGVVGALYSCVRAFTKEGEGVIIQTPVYPPFKSAVLENGRTLFDCPLIRENGRWRMDYEALAAAAKRPEVKLALFCSPHNPAGRVWTKEELSRYAGIMAENGVTVISDEIHSDLIMPGFEHTVFANVPEADPKKYVVCTSASKTFNLAGLTTSNIIIPDGKLRSAFSDRYQMDTSGYISALGVPAVIAAYNKAESWLDELIPYIAGNAEAAAGFFLDKFPQIGVDRPEGTYLMWLDFSKTGLTEKQLDRWLYDEALFFVEDGKPFGPSGAQHRRLNLACPRWALMEALARMDGAAKRLDIRR